MKYRLFVLVRSSQQREERTKKRRRSYRAFWLVVSVAVGVCGTRSDQTVLALFLPSPLRLRCPIKVELISPFSGFIQLSFSIPPSLRATSPIAHTCAEEEINAFLLNCLCFLPPVSILCAIPRILGDTVGGSLIPDLLLLQPMFSTPPSFGHLPYILRYKTQGRSF